MGKSNRCRKQSCKTIRTRKPPQCSIWRNARSIPGQEDRTVRPSAESCAREPNPSTTHHYPHPVQRASRLVSGGTARFYQAKARRRSSHDRMIALGDSGGGNAESTWSSARHVRPEKR